MKELDPKKKKKLEKLLREQSLPPEHKAIGKLIFAVEDKLDEILAIIKSKELTKKE